MKNKLAEINAFIEKHDHFLIASHMDPDGDSIGSQLAIYHALIDAGKQATIVNQGHLPSRYRFLDPSGIIHPSVYDHNLTAQAVFFVECPSLDRIGFVRDMIPDPAITINIDHHLNNTLYADVNIVDSESCAAAEIVYTLLRMGDFEITPEIAKQLYAAIISDTGRFKFDSTTATGMRVASELIGYGADPKTISDHIYNQYSAATIHLLGRTLSQMKLAGGDRIGCMHISRKDLREIGARAEDSEGFVDYSLAVHGVQLGIMLKEMDDKEIKVSVRSQDGIDALGFAKLYGGGGHSNAAGFIQEGNLEDVTSMVLERAVEYLDGR